MVTERVYLNDTYQFEVEAQIIRASLGGSGAYVVLDKTVFSPQGGGQPSDQGTIAGDGFVLLVSSVKLIDGEIRHFVDQDADAWVGSGVICHIDSERRLLNARLHSGGHLISNVVENMYPAWKAVKGHHFPGESYVEFKGKPGSSAIQEEIQRALLQAASADMPSKIEHWPRDKVIELFPYMASILTNNDDVRIMAIGDFPAAPCSGTHVKSSGELKGLEIESIKIKGDTMKVKYGVKLY